MYILKMALEKTRKFYNGRKIGKKVFSFALWTSWYLQFKKNKIKKS